MEDRIPDSRRKLGEQMILLPVFCWHEAIKKLRYKLSHTQILWGGSCKETSMKKWKSTSYSKRKLTSTRQMTMTIRWIQQQEELISSISTWQYKWQHQSCQPRCLRILPGSQKHLLRKKYLHSLTSLLQKIRRMNTIMSWE